MAKVLVADPRKRNLEPLIEQRLPEAAFPSHADEALRLLREGRTVETLQALTAATPKNTGMNYQPEAISLRAERRLRRAVGAAETHGSRKPGVALDVGCARGENAPALRKAGYDAYIGLDLSDGLFPPEDARPKNTRFITASAEAIPLADASVDLAVSYNVMEHIRRPARAIGEIMRVLRPGGVFYTEFGPPFNAAQGPHLNRFLDLPYMHHLFHTDVVAKFVDRRHAYATVNMRPLSYYRAMFFTGRDFDLPFYRETVGEAGFWLIRSLPELLEKTDLEELGVNMIKAVLVKR